MRRVSAQVSDWSLPESWAASIASSASSAAAVEPSLPGVRDGAADRHRHEQVALAGRAADGERTLVVAVDVVPAREALLGPADQERRVEAAREHVVAEGVEPGRGLVEQHACRGDVRHVVLGECERPRRARDQALVPECPRRGQRVGGVRAHPGPVGDEVARLGELEPERRGRRRAGIGLLGERAGEQRVRGLPVPEQLLEHRDEGDEPAAQLGLVDEREDLRQRVAAGGQLARRAERGRHRDEQPEPLLLRRLRGQQAQRRGPPLRGGRWGARRGVGGRLPQDRDRLAVAGLRALLEVMRAARRSRPLSREHGRDARVRPELPARAGLRVDRLAHDRVAEAELPRRARLGDDLGRHQLVERGERRRFAQLGGGGRELRGERIGRDRAAARERERGRRERGEFVAERVEDLAGHAAVVAEMDGRRAGRAGRRAHVWRGDGRVRRGRPATRHALRLAPGQRVEEERVAAAALVDRVPARRRDARQERLGVRPRERPERDPPAAAQRAHERFRGLTGPQAEHDGERRRAPREVRDQLDRGAVGPVGVVEHEQRLAGVGEPLEQASRRLEQAVALAAQARHEGAGEHRGELAVAAAEPPHALGAQGREGVGEERERDAGLELGRGAAQHVPARAQRRQQARLADPRLALDDHEAAARAPQQGQLALAVRSAPHRPMTPHPGPVFRSKRSGIHPIDRGLGRPGSSPATPRRKEASMPRTKLTLALTGAAVLGLTSPALADTKVSIESGNFGSGLNGIYLFVRDKPSVFDTPMNVVIKDEGTKIRISDANGDVVDGGACTELQNGDALCPEGVDGALIWGGNKSDQITNLTALPSAWDGDSGNDLLVGGPGPDQMNGGPGDDTFKANGGNDSFRFEPRRRRHARRQRASTRSTTDPRTSSSRSGSRTRSSTTARRPSPTACSRPRT